MDRFKFRAWDNLHHKYFEPTYEAYKGNLEELLIGPSGQLNIRTIDKLIHESLFPGRFVLERYTGIKDKNGKEIYEGDIVRKEYGQSFIKKRLNEHIGIVELCEYEVLTDSWDVKYVATGWNMEFSDKSGRTAINAEYEVIGNIHENHELLNKED